MACSRGEINRRTGVQSVKGRVGGKGERHEIVIGETDTHQGGTQPGGGRDLGEGFVPTVGLKTSV